MLHYHQLTVGLVDSALVLSYLRSDNIDALTPMWKVYDLFKPKGTMLAVMVQQCRSRVMLMAAEENRLAVKSNEVLVLARHPLPRPSEAEKERLWVNFIL